MVWVNTYRYIRWSTPYGGFKASGWGRENGIEALDSYLETAPRSFRPPANSPTLR